MRAVAVTIALYNRQTVDHRTDYGNSRAHKWRRDGMPHDEVSQRGTSVQNTALQTCRKCDVSRVRNLSP